MVKERFIEFFKNNQLKARIKSRLSISNLCLSFMGITLLAASVCFVTLICQFLFIDSGVKSGTVMSFGSFILMCVVVCIIDIYLSKKTVKKIMLFNNLFSEIDKKELIVYLMSEIQDDSEKVNKVKEFVASLDFKDIDSPKAVDSIVIVNDLFNITSELIERLEDEEKPKLLDLKYKSFLSEFGSGNGNASSYSDMMNNKEINGNVNEKAKESIIERF